MNIYYLIAATWFVGALCMGARTVLSMRLGDATLVELNAVVTLVFFLVGVMNLIVAVVKASPGS